MKDCRDKGLPRHIAIIMDGNGRWAQKRRRPRIYGHVRGCRRVREIVHEAHRLGVGALTLFAFSTENWQRPVLEVGVLMNLLRKWLLRERRELMDMGIQVRTIGSLERLPGEVRRVVEETVALSATNKGLILTLALSYGAREEMVQAVKRLARRVASGEMGAESITAESIDREVFGNSDATVGPPDLLVRTSGESRVSNFLLWQLAYTELYFTSVLWPDFGVEAFKEALDSFSRRERRFGLTSEQLSLTVKEGVIPQVSPKVAAKGERSSSDLRGEAPLL